VIAGLPFVLAFGLYLLNPTYMSPLFSSEQLICMPAFGLPILATVMVFAGYLAIRKIVAIEV
jgi:Flp pilus assembly protein TadB